MAPSRVVVVLKWDLHSEPIETSLSEDMSLLDLVPTENPQKRQD